MASIVGFVIRGGRTRSKSFEEFGRAVLDASSYTYFELRRHERGEPAALIIDGRVFRLDASRRGPVVLVAAITSR
jgi:hypothetical protein